MSDWEGLRARGIPPQHVITRQRRTDNDSLISIKHQCNGLVRFNVANKAVFGLVDLAMAASPLST